MLIQTDSDFGDLKKDRFMQNKLSLAQNTAAHCHPATQILKVGPGSLKNIEYVRSQHAMEANVHDKNEHHHQ